ncbi:MAG TPA: aminotransferase class V-fold PLP-dependent enzyme [Actinomycetes bacterium]|nr:aminotransferase class V-fold PLP-dependent enzyme [Actinomycetes bacterium]
MMRSTTETVDSSAGSRTNPAWGSDWAQVAALWRLDPAMTHLNHGSFGAVPTPVLEEQHRWRDRMETNPQRFFTRGVTESLVAARGEIAQFFGLGADELALVRNATTGVNTVFACAGLQPGDEVLLTEHGYGAVRIAADRACARAGARVVLAAVPLAVTDDEIVDRVLAAVTPRTRLAVIDQVTSATARAMPLDRLVPALQERGVAVCVDAAHAPGMLDVDLARLAPDYWTGNLHKWAWAPRGTAVLYAAPTRRTGLRPLVASWNDDLGFPGAFDRTGTDDLTAWLAAPAALRLMKELGLDRVREHNRRLVQQGRATLATAVSEQVPEAAVLPTSDGSTLSMALVALPPGVAVDLAGAEAWKRRIAEHAGVEVAVTTFRGQGLLRLSAQVYNCPADYEVLARRLPTLLADAAA